MAGTMEQQVWLITGANSGLGFALAGAVLQRGGSVVAAVRSREHSTVEQLQEMGGSRTLIVQLDTTDTDSVQAAVVSAVSTFGRLDVAVNCAGRGSFGSVEETPEEEVRSLMDVNFFGSLNVLRGILPILRRQQGGHIVQISSLAGIAPPAAGLGAYAASKFAVEGMFEVLAQEIAHLGIRVTIGEPGDFRTGFGAALRVTAPALSEYAASVGAAGQALALMDPARFGDPGRAAEAIVNVVNAENPPLRLALGDDAFDGIEAKLSGQLDSLREWELTSRSMR